MGTRRALEGFPFNRKRFVKSMDSRKFLQRIFDGYVNCYRQFNWHASSNYADMTAVELNFFADLGQRLGYFVGREMHWDYPRDLCWCEEPPGRDRKQTKYVLYLERENEDGRVLENTVNKMLNPANAPGVPYLVAVLGWVKPGTLEKAKALIRERLPSDQSFLLISWVGESKNGEFFVEGWLAPSGGFAETARSAAAEPDAGGYWSMRSTSAWT